MVVIFSDTNKFAAIGNVKIFDNTALPEQRIQKKLLEFYKNYLISKSVYKKIS